MSNDVFKITPAIGLLTAVFRIVSMVMRVAPIGAFGAMAFTIGAYGLGSLLSLGQVLVCVYFPYS